MAVESNLAFGGEPDRPKDDSSFEPAKSRRKNRRKRRAERARERIREAHTIWIREDPDHLQPLEAERPASEKSDVREQEVVPRNESKLVKPAAVSERPAKALRNTHTDEAPKVAQRSERVPESSELPRQRTETAQNFAPEVTMPAPQTREAPARKSPQPELLADLLKLQELPHLDIRPNHFYAESEVRQSDTTATEHDILPSAQQPGRAAEQAPVHQPEQQKEQPKQPTKNEREKHANNESSAPKPVEKPAKASQQKAELAVVPEMKPTKPAVRVETQPPTKSTEPELSHAGEQLQQIAEQKTQRAAELADKHSRQSEIAPRTSEKQAEKENAPATRETDARMGEAELLSLADSIRVEGISVAEMFRAGRLDKVGLRRVVMEFLRGNPIEKILAEEVLRLQMKFERDPQLRQAPVHASNGAAKRAAARAKESLRPQNVRHHANHFADHVAIGLDRVFDAVENHPQESKVAGGVLAVVLYFVILILIIKS